MKERMDCPNCGSSRLEGIFEITDVPVNSVVLVQDKNKAIDFKRGDILLTLCRNCSFIFNSVYDPSSSRYSIEYEGTQSFSPVYREFLVGLADRLIRDLSIEDKKIIEIGCGQGEFLEILCDHGRNIGIGYDPSYRGELRKGSISFVRDFFNMDASMDLDVSLIVCKMTLEHIQETKSFVSSLRRYIGDYDTRVFFQVPDFENIIDEGAFWDVYYEHCSYFCMYSLDYLFRSSGFKVVDLWRDYDDQYLFITAEPASDIEGFQKDNHGFDLDIEGFKGNIQSRISRWRDFFRANKDKRIILWGGGSKAVAFLSTLKIDKEIDFVVDINPNKDRTYLPVSGHLVVNPGYLKDFFPDIVIVMNPVYIDEVTDELDQMGIHPRIVSIEES